MRRSLTDPVRLGAVFASRQRWGYGSIGRSGVELEGFAGFAGGLYVGGRMVLERNGERD